MMCAITCLVDRVPGQAGSVVLSYCFSGLLQDETPEQHLDFFIPTTTTLLQLHPDAQCAGS